MVYLIYSKIYLLSSKFDYCLMSTIYSSHDMLKILITNVKMTGTGVTSLV